MPITQLAGGPTGIAMGQDLLTNSSTQQMPLGFYSETVDGRGFRYMKVGAVATVPGQAYQQAAEDTTNQTPSGGLAVAASAIGSTTVTLTGSLTIAANLLAGGYLSVDVTPGQGYLYLIKSNTAVTAATGCVITLEDPLQVALTTSSKVIIRKHPFDGIVVQPSTVTGMTVGVANTIISAGNYGWIQTHGPCSCLFTGTGVSGKAVGVLSGGTAGSLAPAIAATPVVGYNMSVSITGEYALIYLTLN